jgi:hypothetical protein
VKRLSILLLFFLTLFSACQTKPTNDDSIIITEIKETTLDSNYIEWYGRHHYQDERMYFYHTATGFKVQFYGRVVEVEMYLENKKNIIYYSVVKNDEDILLAETYTQSDPISNWIIEFDTFDHHTVEIIKRSEPEDGITSLSSIRTNGYFEVVELEERLHFLMLGASGLSGHGALGLEGQPRTTANSSSLHAFGFLTAMAFEGSFEFVASSGWGLLFGYNDLSGENNIAKAYDYVGINPNRNIVELEYLNHKVPDFIIVNLGGNDYTSTINRLTGFERTEKISEFKSAVAALILKLRADAPNGHILWTMTPGSMNGIAASEVINMLDPNDKKYVHIVIIHQVGSEGDPIGANGHASYITHQKSALVLVEQIETILSNNNS